MADVLQNFERYFAITPSDTDDFATAPDAIYVGGAGNIVAVLPDGTAVTFTGALAGSILPIKCKRVNATSTTATALVGLVQA